MTRLPPKNTNNTIATDSKTGSQSIGKIAYIMSRFPKLTETFILYEILEVQRQGVRIEIFPLLRERQKVTHPEVQILTENAHFHPFLSLRILGAQLHYLLRKPLVYLRLWFEVLRGTLGSFNFFFGAIGVFPKSVRFALEMERLGINHIHAHFATHPAVAGLIIHRLTGIPFSFTAHGSDLHVERKMLDKKVAAAAFAVTVSAYNKAVMVQTCGENLSDKIHVIHCGVDPDHFPPKSAPGVANSYQILCVASFEEVKGHKHLIEACELLSTRGIDFDCHFVGNGPLRANVERQIACTDLAEKFHVHGSLPRPEVIDMLQRADVFALASIPTKQGKREGIPVVLMEAMASGLPVVSSDLSGIPELVKNGVSGLLVPPGDSLLLTNALETLYRDPKCRVQMGRSGRKHVVEEFNLHTNALKLIELFAASSAHRGKTV
jgi:glycosyltransferase involved in cell wall biosynthesis